MSFLRKLILAAAMSAVVCSCAPKKSSSDKLVALSFDDGPSNVTESILETLKKENIKATFFVVGSWARNDSLSVDNTKFMKEAHDMGCVIGNHTWTHPYLTKLSDEEIMEEVNRNSDFIESVVGERPQYLRCPYLDENEKMHQMIDMTFIGGINCEDWNPDVTSEMRTQRILDQVKDGDIILIHDFYGNTQTAEAIKTLIPELKARGYEFVTIPELFDRNGIQHEAHNGKTYFNVMD